MAFSKAYQVEKTASETEDASESQDSYFTADFSLPSTSYV